MLSSSSLLVWQEQAYAPLLTLFDPDKNVAEADADTGRFEHQ